MTILMIKPAIAADIQLPKPDKTNTTTLITALENRHSDRSFADKQIDNKTLSTLLWAAYGVNRADGKRTIPTAMGKKDLNVYVFNKDGVWLYDADMNALRQQICQKSFGFVSITRLYEIRSCCLGLHGQHG